MIGFPSKRGLTAGAFSLFLVGNTLLGAVPGHRPKLNPVTWSLSTGLLPIAPGSTIILHLHANVADGYHLYSVTTPVSGPIATVIDLKGNSGFNQVRVFQPTPKRYADPVLGITVESFSGNVEFPIEVHLQKDLAAGSRTVTVHVRYQSCSSKICLPPVERDAEANITIALNSRKVQELIPATVHLVAGPKFSASD